MFRMYSVTNENNGDLTHAEPNIYRDPELAKLEFEARSKKVGLWKEPD